MDESSTPTGGTAVALLRDPVRSRLFTFVRRSDEAVTREAAAAAAGISPKLAAFHLDKMAAAGLLVAGTGAPAGRRGRAPKVYSPAAGEWQVSVPPRRYDVLAEVLAAALGEVGAAGRDAAGRVAADTGRRLGERVRADRRLGRLGPERALAIAAEVLDEAGYEPSRTPDAITLRNCPFSRLAVSEPEVVCVLNEHLIAGLLDGLGATPAVHAALVPPEQGCCVQVHR